MTNDIPKREKQEYSLEDAREMGVSLTKLRVGCSAHAWQVHLIEWGKVQWDKMGTQVPDEE